MFLNGTACISFIRLAPNLVASYWPFISIAEKGKGEVDGSTITSDATSLSSSESAYDDSTNDDEDTKLLVQDEEPSAGLQHGPHQKRGMFYTYTLRSY